MVRGSGMFLCTLVFLVGCGSSDAPSGADNGKAGASGSGSAATGSGGTGAGGASSTGYLECDLTIVETELPSGRTYTKHECIEQTFNPAFPGPAEDNCMDESSSAMVTKVESTTDHCPTDPTTPSTSCIDQMIPGGLDITRWNYDIYTSIDPSATGAQLTSAQQEVVGIYQSACTFGGTFATYNVDGAAGSN